MRATTSTALRKAALIAALVALVAAAAAPVVAAPGDPGMDIEVSRLAVSLRH